MSDPRSKLRPRPSVGRLLLVVNAIALLIPIVAIAFFRLYEKALVEQTERRLIGESVLVGQVWRDLYLEASGQGRRARGFRPRTSEDPKYSPVHPVVDLSRDVLPPEPAPVRRQARRVGPAWSAGRKLVGLLQRSKVFNLSAMRVLDTNSCVVATSGADLGACYDTLEPVDRALDGHYAAVARQRFSDEPAPPLASIRRAGKVRVFTALPVFVDRRVIGVVKASRTSLSVVNALWRQRGTVLFAFGACLLLTALMSGFLARTISRPVRQITDNAQLVAAGRGQSRFSLLAFAPKEVEQLNAALQRMLDRLEERTQYIAEFSANVSHELKTPLTSMRGAAQLLRDSWQQMSEEQRRRFVDNIEEDTQRMERLINGLLQLARIEVGVDPGATVDVATVFSSLADRFGDDRVSMKNNEQGLRVAGTLEHLETALSNLLDNAQRYAKRSVVLSLERQGDCAAFVVVDDGPGVSEGNRDKIFQRFFTTDRARGGTGLGLAIVSAIAQRYGGSLELAEGTTNTTFRLSLPCETVND